MKKLAACVSLLALLSLAPCEAGAVRFPGHFGEMDINEDGYVTWDEAVSYVPNLKRSDFDAVDRNHDGRIDYSEWQASRTKFGLVKEGLGNEHKDIKSKDLSAADQARIAHTKAFKSVEKKKGAADQKTGAGTAVQKAKDGSAQPRPKGDQAKRTPTAAAQSPTPGAPREAASKASVKRSPAKEQPAKASKERTAQAGGRQATSVRSVDQAPKEQPAKSKEQPQ